MTDLDTRMRLVARALVDEAPEAPLLLPGLHGQRPARRPHAAAAVVAVAAAAVVAGVVLVARDGGTTQVALSPDDPPGSPACSATPPLDVTVPDATGGPFPGPAPGGAPVADGQSVRHWTRADGTVELRWPAPAVPLYGDNRGPLLPLGQTMSPRRTELDVFPFDSGRDVVVDRRDGPAPPAPCDVVELVVTSSAGRWAGGLRSTPEGGLGSTPEGELRSTLEVVDLQPRIVERRPVEAAPTTAIPCEDRRERNRHGGPDPAVRGPEPADVLLAYLAARPGAPQSGYIEMAEPDGSITYGVQPSGTGWTTLVSVARDHDGWYLEGWTASGC